MPGTDQLSHIRSRMSVSLPGESGGHVPTVTGSAGVSWSGTLWDAIDGHMGTSVGGKKPR
jgi:hypothetical protein